MFKPSIPVLMYHHINNNRLDLVTISPEDFESQIKYLKKANYETLFLSDMIAFIEGRKKISKKSIVITFDDGFLDNWIYAYPILKKYQMKATIFIVTGWIKESETIRLNYEDVDKKKCTLDNLLTVPTHRNTKQLIREKKYNEVMMNWKEVEIMHQSGLIDIQSHTHEHHNMADKGEEFIKNDLALSKEKISQKLNKKCHFLAWPWGKYSNAGIKVAKEVQYKGAATVKRGLVFPGGDPYQINRIVVKKGDIGWFRSRMFIYSNSILGSLYIRMRL